MSNGLDPNELTDAFTQALRNAAHQPQQAQQPQQNSSVIIFILKVLITIVMSVIGMYVYAWATGQGLSATQRYGMIIVSIGVTTAVILQEAVRRSPGIGDNWLGFGAQLGLCLSIFFGGTLFTAPQLFLKLIDQTQAVAERQEAKSATATIPAAPTSTDVELIGDKFVNKTKVAGRYYYWRPKNTTQINAFDVIVPKDVKNLEVWFADAKGKNGSDIFEVNR